MANSKKRTQAMRRIRHIHFVGIGGVGMGGIAEVLIAQGYKVTGTDLNENRVTKHLTKLGAEIMFKHLAKHVKNVDVVVMSSAVSEDNPEIKAARALRIPVIPRAEMLAELMRYQHGIAVAGTHGKTTTTSLIATLLTEGGLDPTFVIGGLLNSAGSNARMGLGRHCVAEADESDASFLYLNPMVAVVTNIDMDHMGTYLGNFESLKQTFIDFLHNLPFYGLAVLCLDDPIVKEIAPKISRPKITYGFNPKADIYATDYFQDGVRCHFTVQSKDEIPPFQVTLNLPGKHNVLNALASIVVAREVGVSLDVIKSTLENFAGIGRRFQIYGDFDFKGGNVMLIDDYGHHPSEVNATIQAARQAWPKRRLVMAYQPHRYTRTRDLFDDFVRVLSEVDELVLLDIYSAGEEPIRGAEGVTLCNAISAYGKISPTFVPRQAPLQLALNNVLQPGDILLTQGAGDIGGMSAKLAEQKLMFNESVIS